MKRGVADGWTRFVHDQSPLLSEIDVHVPSTPEIRKVLQADLRLDAMLRALGRKLSHDDTDGFVSNMTERLRSTNDSERFTRVVSRVLRRRRLVRRIGVAAVLVATAAAAAWQASLDRQDGAVPQGVASIYSREHISTRDASPTPTVSPSGKRLPTAGRTPRELLFVVGNIPVKSNDALLMRRFERLGFRTTVKLPLQLSLVDGTASDLVAVGSSVESAAFSFDDLGLADCPNNDGCGWVVADGSVTLPSRGSPIIAAGKSAVTMSNFPTVYSFGNPHESASVIAKVATDQIRDVFFVYERGAVVPDGSIPARRVAMFLSDDTARVLTEDGWALFDAAIEWVTDGDR